MRLLRNQGMEQQYENEVVGFNTRMTDVHAAIGRVQLAKLAGVDRTSASATPRSSTRTSRASATPPVADGAAHVYHQYTIRVPDDRDGFAAALGDEHGVGTGVYYPIPNHRLPSFQVDVDLPETERAAAEVLSLPVHPSLSQDDLERDRRRRSTPSRRRAPDGEPARRADRPRHDGPPPRPRPAAASTASSSSRSPTRPVTRTASPAVVPVEADVEELIAHGIDYCVVAVPTHCTRRSGSRSPRPACTR